MSVEATSMVWLLRVFTKMVFGMVMGLLFASGGAATSTRISPVAVWSPSFTTYSR